jgi:hypothetical protein
MASAVRTYVRDDEKQFVFIIESDGGFRAVETAELWEEPRISASVMYHYYPTVIQCDGFDSIEEAVQFIVARYEWIGPGAAVENGTRSDP